MLQLNRVRLGETLPIALDLGLRQGDEVWDRKRKGGTDCSGRPGRVLSCLLHIRVGRAFAALRDDPVDVLGRVLDVAGLTVDAVLRVDL